MIELVRVNELGLVIPPKQIDCIGEYCPVAEKLGHCFVDEHELYFSRARYMLHPLSAKFRNHPFNRIMLARCIHNSAYEGSIHKQAKEIPMPKARIMARFLEEAEILQSIGNIVVKSDGLLSKIEEDKIWEIEKQSQREDAWYEAQAELDELTRRAQQELEVVASILPFMPHKVPQLVGRLLLDEAA